MTSEEAGKLKKRSRESVTPKAVATALGLYAEKVTVENLMIVRQEHPDTKLTKKEATKIKG